SPQPARPVCVLTEDPPWPPPRAPDVPLPPPRRDRNRHEWIVAAPLHAGERRPRERDRQERGHDGGRGGRGQPLRRPEEAARAAHSARAASNCGVAGGPLTPCRSAPCRARISSGI